MLGAVLGAALLLGACSSSSDESNDRSGAAEPPAAAGPTAVRPTAADPVPGAAAAAPSPAGTGQAGAGSGTGSSKAPAAPNNTPAVQDRKLVLTADVRLEADDPEAAAANARTLTIGLGGLIAGEQTTRSPRTVTVPPPAGSTEPPRQETVYVTTSALTLKVPPAQFDKALDQLSALGTVIGRNRTATDITEQVVDVQSRIETQRRSVERVRELLAKATSLGEIVSIEAEVTRREADLESLLKRQQTLTAQSDLATIALAVNSRPEPAPRPQAPEPPKKDDGGESFGGAVLDALGGGWHAFYVTVRGILVVLAAVLPFLAAFLVLMWLLRRYGRPLREWIAARRAPRDDEPFVGWRERQAPHGAGRPAATKDDAGSEERAYAGAGTSPGGSARGSAGGQAGGAQGGDATGGAQGGTAQGGSSRPAKPTTPPGDSAP